MFFALAEGVTCKTVHRSSERRVEGTTRSDLESCQCRAKARTAAGGSRVRMLESEVEAEAKRMATSLPVCSRMR